jgi:N-acetylmuramoyl-L-alanine amidase
MNILLIAGHGEGDPGACALGYKEADITREIAPKLKSALSKYATVTLFDPSKSMYKYLKSGKSFDFKKFDYVVELHLNACVNDTKGNGKTTGSEILVHPLEKGVSVEESILSNLEKLGFRNRGVKTRTNLQNMNICKKKQGVSYALIEVCFIDDLDDMKLYQAKKDEVVNAITQGIIKGFKLNQVVNNSMNNTEPSKKMLTSANDITWELNKSFFPITETQKFVKELDEAKKNNSSLYWGYYKLVNKIK